MIIRTNSIIRIWSPPANFRKAIEQRLTKDNPQYIKMLKMGKMGYGVPQEVKFYECGPDGELVLPRGLLDDIKASFANANDIDVTWIGAMEEGEDVDYNSQITLRPYQSPAVDAVKKHKQGVIVMPCGAGKTETGLQIIAELGKPALWVTHTKDLLAQSMNRAKDKLGLTGNQIGQIGGGKWSIGTHITFATVQSLAHQDLNSMCRKFGAIVIDECHRAFISPTKAGVFQKVINQFPAQYRVGLTASEHRADGLLDGMYYLIGPKIYEVKQEELNKLNNVVKPTVKPILTDFKAAANKDEYGAILAEMIANEKRNALILSLLRNSLTAPENSVLVLSDRLEHLEKLKAALLFTNPGIETVFVSRKTPARQRVAALQSVRDGTARVLFATYTLAKEGLDIPRLNRLIMCTPHRDKVCTQQSVGRIMRPAEGKTDAVVYDLLDGAIGLMKSQYYGRRAVYKEIGCEIEQPRKGRK